MPGIFVITICLLCRPSAGRKESDGRDVINEECRKILRLATRISSCLTPASQLPVLHPQHLYFKTGPAVRIVHDDVMADEARFLFSR